MGNGFERAVPATAAELAKSLTKMVENQKHVVSVRVNPANQHIEIDFDGAANSFLGGQPDLYMPIEKGKVEQAKQLVEQLVQQMRAKQNASAGQVQEIFDLIDHQGK